MSVPTDTIGDFLTRIRNASRARKEKMTAPASKMTVRIAEILKQEGYIDNFKCIQDESKKFVRIHLKYVNKKPAIQQIQRISKPGIRYYVDRGSIPRVLGGLGIALLSTSKGVMTDRQARTQGIGGEIVCKVW